jgi:hypothetical protein
MLPVAAYDDAIRAAAGLADDFERLAGALYEAGSAAIYEARFDDALRYAFDLQHRRGRYAIPRWQAWGAWLEVVTQCHLNNVGRAGRLLETRFARFIDEDRPDALADLRNIELLHARLKLANNIGLGAVSLTDPADAARRGRYRDDLDLLLADIAIAQGRPDEAVNRIARVLSDPSCPVAEMWAKVGHAELARLGGQRDAAAEAFAGLAHDAHTRGATWLELQAIAGLYQCGDDRYESRWTAARQSLAHISVKPPARPTDGPQESTRLSPLATALQADSIRPLIIGKPRILWMMTV